MLLPPIIGFVVNDRLQYFAGVFHSQFLPVTKLAQRVKLKKAHVFEPVRLFRIRDMSFFMLALRSKIQENKNKGLKVGKAYQRVGDRFK